MLLQYKIYTNRVVKWFTQKRRCKLRMLFRLSIRPVHTRDKICVPSPVDLFKLQKRVSDSNSPSFSVSTLSASYLDVFFTKREFRKFTKSFNRDQPRPPSVSISVRKLRYPPKLLTKYKKIHYQLVHPGDLLCPLRVLSLELYNSPGSLASVPCNVLRCTLSVIRPVLRLRPRLSTLPPYKTSEKTSKEPSPSPPI